MTKKITELLVLFDNKHVYDLAMSGILVAYPEFSEVSFNQTKMCFTFKINGYVVAKTNDGLGVDGLTELWNQLTGEQLKDVTWVL